MENNKYFCPMCNKNIFIEDKKIKLKNRRVLTNAGMLVNTDGIFRLTKAYEDYRVGYFICPYCKKISLYQSTSRKRYNNVNL